MKNSTKKPLLFSILILSTAALVGCSTNKNGGNSSDAKYTIQFQGLDDFKKNFVELGPNTYLEGSVTSFEPTHRITFNFTEALDPTNLKIYCNGELATFEVADNDSLSGRELYIPHTVICNSVTIAGKKKLDYLVDVTDCTINYNNIKLDIKHEDSNEKIKYYIEPNRKNVYEYGKHYMSFETSKVTLLDVPEDNIIKQPAGTSLSLFAPKAWNLNKLVFETTNKEHSYSFESINPYKNDESYYVSYKNKLYTMLNNTYIASNGTVINYEDYDKNNEIKWLFITKDRFNIVALDAFDSCAYDMFMEKDIYDSLYPNGETARDFNTLKYDDNGQEKTLITDMTINGKCSVDNGIVYQNFPMRFNDESHKEGYKVYDCYIAYTLNHGRTLTSTNYNGISFGLFDENFDTPKITIPSSDIKHVFQPRINREDTEYLIFKITPEMIEPYLEEYVFNDDPRVYEHVKAGKLFLLPIFEDTSNFAKFTWDFKEINSLLNTEGDLSKIKNLMLTYNDGQFDQRIYPLMTLDKNNRLISLLDKTYLDNAKLSFTLTGNKTKTSTHYGQSKIKSVGIKQGLSNIKTHEMTLEDGDLNILLNLRDSKTSNYEYDLKVFINLLDSFNVKLDFSKVVNNPTYEVYYSTTAKDFNEFTKLTKENVKSLNIELQPRSTKPDARFYYYIKSKDSSDTSSKRLTFPFIKEVLNDGEIIMREEKFFNSECLLDIYSNVIKYNDAYIYYIDTINGYNYNYNEDLTLEVQIAEC